MKKVTCTLTRVKADRQAHHNTHTYTYILTHARTQTPVVETSSSASKGFSCKKKYLTRLSVKQMTNGRSSNVSPLFFLYKNGLLQLKHPVRLRINIHFPTVRYFSHS